MAKSTGRTGDSRPHYRAFLVRVWRDRESAPWRASVTHVVGGELHKFTELPEAWEHIQQQLDTEADGEEVDGS